MRFTQLFVDRIVHSILQIILIIINTWKKNFVENTKHYILMINIFNCVEWNSFVRLISLKLNYHAVQRALCWLHNSFNFTNKFNNNQILKKNFVENVCNCIFLLLALTRLNYIYQILDDNVLCGILRVTTTW